MLDANTFHTNKLSVYLSHAMCMTKIDCREGVERVENWGGTWKPACNDVCIRN